MAVCFASVENVRQYVAPFARCKELLTVAKLQQQKGSTNGHTDTHDLNHGDEGRFHFRVIFMCLGYMVRRS
jgi:hypothetical protein